jgi:UDP-2-acetamido-2,6-beta-L-arabino-hexul-4-ose reductase
MKNLKVLVTGSNGFIGKNLCARLEESGNIFLLKYDLGMDDNKLFEFLNDAEIIYHLAGSNRPEVVSEFESVNLGLTEKIIDHLIKIKRKPKIIFASTTQAVLENPYGISKYQAEESLFKFSEQQKANIKIYRLANVFGKWCRPNYNSVVATFCHNIAYDLSITINNPETKLNLIYIDDVINNFISDLDTIENIGNHKYYSVEPVFQITLGYLAEKLYSFKDMRDFLSIPDMSDLFTKYLYTTYLSYLPSDKFNYKLISKFDDRGSLTELLKSSNIGQIFISKTKAGITRGNHYHHTKVEKFIVLNGKADISFRKINGIEIIKYSVSGDNIEVVDIPPGYTHNIQNIGDEEMIVLFWSSEIFNPNKTDTFSLKV